MNTPNNLEINIRGNYSICKIPFNNEYMIKN